MATFNIVAAIKTPETCIYFLSLSTYLTRGPTGSCKQTKMRDCNWKSPSWFIFVIIATLLPGGADGWSMDGDDTAMSQRADTPDRTGLSSEMSEFLDWAFENGLDFEVRYYLPFGSSDSSCTLHLPLRTFSN